LARGLREDLGGELDALPADAGDQDLALQGRYLPLKAG
jgi:hypothetical protein